MSRFFKGAVSSSDSESSSGSDDEQQQVPVSKKAPIRDFAYPSDREDEEKRVVKTHKDRRFEELKQSIKDNKHAKNIKDLARVLELFEKITKTFTASKTVFMRQNISTPRFYLRYLVELEDYINEIWENAEVKKSMSKANAKGLNGLRQKVRKYNKDLEKDILEYKQSPDAAGYETPEDEEGAASDNDVKTTEAPAKEKKLTKKAPQRNLDSDSDEEWTESDGSSDTDDEIDLENMKMENLRKYFLKKEFREGGKDDAKKKERKQRVNKEKVLEEEEDDGEGWIPVPRKEDKVVPLFEPKQEITHEVMIKKLAEVMSVRGRKSTNRKQHVRTLQELLNITSEKNLGAGLLAKIFFYIISSLFELSSKISDFMDFSTWAKTLTTINSLLDLLVEHPEVELSIKIQEEDENLQDATVPYKVNGSFLLCVHRLDNELTKILQNADCHSNDYIDKLKGEKDMCSLIERTQEYVDKHIGKNLFDNEEVSKIYMLRIEHLYYKYEDTSDTGAQSASDIIDGLCKKIYALDDEKRLRQRAMLCHVYHMALHDKWQEARDLMLMSHMQAVVEHSDVATQILYNRTICQLGLCAFRHGFIKEAHQGMSEIQNTQRAKELLAQGMVMRQSDRTLEQEKVERSRQVPYHMHINIELMECVYLISSMLLEIPHMASQEFEMRRRMLSRSFHYQLKQSEKASLVGPPENTREHVVAASRAMLEGDWKKCRDYIVNEKMNQKVWNLFRNADSVRAMVIRRIQEESLRTYLLMYSTVYNTVALPRLSKLFELERKDVHAIISKMILSEELSASLDEPSDCVIMHRVEPSRLQLLAASLADKLQGLQESNEQIMEPRGTGRGYAGPGAWGYGGRGGERGEKGKGQGQGYNREPREGGRPQGQRGERWNAGGRDGQRRREGGGGQRNRY